MKNVEGFWQMLSIQMLLFVYMAIGYGLRKGKILKAEARDAFTEAAEAEQALPSRNGMRKAAIREIFITKKTSAYNNA